MSKKWWIIIGVAVGVGCSATIVGLRSTGLGSFLENMLAGIAVSAFAFAIAVRLIEGPVMTRERRLHKVISMASREVAQLNEQIGITLAREIGEYLASKLHSNTDLCGEERDDWTAFKRLLRAVFEDARRVSVRGLPRSGPISEKDYSSYVEAARKFKEQVGSALGTDWEVQAQLLELVEHRRRLDARIREADYPDNIRDEEARYVRLAAIGDAIIDVIDGCPRIED